MTYIVEIAGKKFYGEPGFSSQWWLKDGLTGWYDSLGNRVDIEDVPGQHGGFTPSQTLVSSRHMVFECAVEYSSATEAESNSWPTKLAAMPGFDVSVTDGSGTKTVKCWIEEQVLSKRISPKVWQYSIPLVAPDPIKYGAIESVKKAAAYIVTDGLQYSLQYPLTYGNTAAAALAGYLQLFNSGSAPVYPTFRVAGPVTVGFQLTSDTYTIKFEKELLVGQEVVFGPAAGGRAILKDESGALTDVSVYLTKAQWAAIPAATDDATPGQRGFVFTPLGVATGGSYVEATIRDGWF